MKVPFRTTNLHMFTEKLSSKRPNVCNVQCAIPMHMHVYMCVCVRVGKFRPDHRQVLLKRYRIYLQLSWLTMANHFNQLHHRHLLATSTWWAVIADWKFTKYTTSHMWIKDKVFINFIAFIAFPSCYTTCYNIPIPLEQ